MFEEQPPRWWLLDRRGLSLRWKLVQLMPAASQSLTVAVVAVVVAGAIVAPLIMVFVGRAVSQVGPAVHAGSGSHAASELFASLVVVGILVALQQANGPLLIHFSDQIGMRAKSFVLRRLLAAHLAPASLAHLEDPNLKDLVERAQQPGGTEIRRGLQAFIMRWSTRLGGAGGLVLLALFQWWAGVAMLAAVIYAAHRARIAHVEISRHVFRQSPTFRHSNYLRDLLLRPGAEKETRVFGLSRWIIGRFSDEWRAAMVPVWERRQRSLVDTAAAVGPVIVVVAGIASVAMHDAIDGSIGAGELVVVLQAMVANLAAIAVTSRDTLVELGVTTLETVEALEAAVVRGPLTMPGRRPANGLPQHEIRFEGVRFSYPGSGQEVLSGVDLLIPAGQSLAIVGANGAGKTTLIKLLLRLYDPTAGVISVDGTGLEEFEPRSWQQRGAAVFQDFLHYPWSAADNVALRPRADGDASTLEHTLEHTTFERAALERTTLERTTLERAARRAGALSIIESLPEGWETVLSRAFGGVDLSGGEWQRVALARALYAGDRGAGILVLDEPTAHLDVRQEAQFYERFLDVTSGLTTIIVSHRFSTVRRANRIVVLERGRVIESGDHDQLVALNGRYAAMFSLQADRYADE